MDGSQPFTPRAEPTAMSTTHLPVMLDECVAALQVRAGGVYMDATFGRGGHSGALLQALDGRGTLHAIDQDPTAEAAAQRFSGRADFVFHRSNFGELAAIATAAGLMGCVDGILMDLGVSSPQLDVAERGFSFSHDGPLDMRMNPDAGEPASAWLARADEAEIADVLWTYGEERNSRRIARRIVESRAEAPITRTAQLAELIAKVPGPRSAHIHPATRSFQAIRIHLNRELEVLRQALAAVPQLLAPGGRLAVMSFHSLEDRIVKQFLRDQEALNPKDSKKNKYAQFSRLESTDADSPRTPHLKEVARCFPSDAECARNPRARSAVLRIAEVSA